MKRLSPAEIREYWAEQARVHGESPAASWSDRRVIELEIAAIGSRLDAAMEVLDVGCANGYSSAHYAQRCARVVGVDYVPEMIENASARRDALPADVRSRLGFAVGDVMELEYADAAFDCVISTRVIINLPSWEKQERGLEECARVLRPGGLFLLSEATEQGWRRLNALRNEWNLPDIPMPSFNRYVDEEQITAALTPQFELIEIENFASSYYVATRIAKPLLAAATGADVDVADPTAEFNRWAATLPAAGDYGTQKLFVFRKRGSAPRDEQ
jgi:ubiquinone/menaquinone biosynthesis C-methylase UbiE